MLDDIQEWKRPDLAENRPLPLVVEVYIDTAHLTPGQALVVTDTVGKRWDVADAVDDPGSRRINSTAGVREVLLERWTVQLGDAEGFTPSQLNDQLPNVYKKAVVLFRSLYTFSRFLPAWKLHRRLNRQTGTNVLLRLRCRIRKGHQTHGWARSSKDSIFTPLCPSDLGAAGVTESHAFEPLLCPAGPLCINLQYRLNCNFSVADSEAVLSSRFAGLDAGLADRSGGRSLPGERSQGGETAYGSAGADRGADSARVARVAGGGAYGSLGTFHTTGKRDSPVTVLRQRALSQEDGFDDTDRSRRLQASSVGRHSGEQDLLKNPPFKAGSVASSPRGLASPSTSAPRASPFGSSIPKRLSLNTLPQQALRTPGAGAEYAIASSGSSSPKPAPLHRYSSSFAGRKRFASQSSKAGESNTSSSGSKEKSGQLPEGTPGSSGSGGGGARTDEDDIAAFISSVEQAKDLKSFGAARKSSSSGGGAGGGAAVASTTVNLARFKGMGVAGAELADEISSSSLIQTSLTPPSRRLSNVPALSTSSSPSSRPLAHAPHVRSRLSTHSIVEEKEGSDEGKTEEDDEEDEEEGRRAGRDDGNDDDDDDEPFIFQQDNIL